MKQTHPLVRKKVFFPDNPCLAMSWNSVALVHPNLNIDTQILLELWHLILLYKMDLSNAVGFIRVVIIFKFLFSLTFLSIFPDLKCPPPPRLQFISSIAKGNTDNSYPLTKYGNKN